MIERIKEKARGDNEIGPYVSLSAWVVSANRARSGPPSGINNPATLASPREIFEAQQKLAEEARRLLRGECFLTGFSMGVMDFEIGSSKALQINVRYQSYGEAAALQPVAIATMKKSRLIELE